MLLNETQCYCKMKFKVWLEFVRNWCSSFEYSRNDLFRWRWQWFLKEMHSFRLERMASHQIAPPINWMFGQNRMPIDVRSSITFSHFLETTIAIEYRHSIPCWNDVIRTKLNIKTGNGLVLFFAWNLENQNITVLQIEH